MTISLCLLALYIVFLTMLVAYGRPFSGHVGHREITEDTDKIEEFLRVRIVREAVGASETLTGRIHSGELHLFITL